MTASFKGNMGFITILLTLNYGLKPWTKDNSCYRVGLDTCYNLLRRIMLYCVG